MEREREGAEGNPGTDFSCLETLLLLRDPGKLILSLLRECSCVCVCACGVEGWAVGTSPFLQLWVLQS